MNSPTQNPNPITLDNFSEEKSKYQRRVTAAVSSIDQERKKALSCPLNRILHYTSSSALTHIHIHTSPLFTKTSPLQCIFHTAVRVVFLKHTLKAWLLSGYGVCSPNSVEVLVSPHTMYISILLWFCSCRNDMPFSPTLNLSKFYLPIKIQHNGCLLNEASLNSSHHDYSFLFDP